LKLTGRDPLTRPTHLSLSHSLLLQSVQTDPTPSGYYHLALSYAIPRGTTTTTQGSTSATSNNANYNLQQAIEYAGLALEADPGDVKYWHLLGLLLAAQERWEQARELLERGADLGVDDADDDAEGDVGEESGGEGFSSVKMGSQDGDKDTSTIEDNGTVQMDARTLHGRPIPNPTTNGDANTIKIDSSGNGLPPPIISNNVNNLPFQSTYVLSQSPSQSPLSSTTPSLPLASTLLLTPPPSKYPPSPHELFESHLQLRMTQGALMEVVEGAEGAERLWLDVFGWVAEKRSAAAAAAAVAGDAGGGGGGVQRRSIDGITQRSNDHISSSHHTTTTTTIDVSPHHLHPNTHHHHHQQQPHYLGVPTNNNQIYQNQPPANGSSDLDTNGSTTDSLPPPIPIPITISPASPVDDEKGGEGGVLGVLEKERDKDKDVNKEKGREKEKDQGKEKKTLNTFRTKPSTSIDIERDNTNRLGLDVQIPKMNVGQIIKGSVKRSRAGITAATKKLGHGVVRHGGLRRSTSTPGTFAWGSFFSKMISLF